MSLKTLDRGRYTLWAIYLLLAWTFANVYHYVLPDNLDVTIRRLVTFTAPAPMQYRVLVPAAIRVLHDVTGMTIMTLNKQFTIFSVFAMMLLFSTFLEEYMPIALARLAAPVILVPLFWNYCLLTFTHYPSDLPGIVIFLQCLLLWRRKQKMWYYVLFTIGCFNRETIIFTLPVIVALEWPVKDRMFWLREVPLHLLIAVCIRISLMRIFANQPGVPFEDHFAYSLSLFRDFFSLRMAITRYFLYLFGGFHLVSLLLIRSVPASLQRVWIVLLSFWAVMVVVGVLLEGRIFGEPIPMYATIVIVGALKKLRMREPVFSLQAT